MRKVLDTKQSKDASLCRICSEPENESNKLSIPCMCIGHLQYVHSNCILSWIQKTRSQICPLCKYKIKIRRNTKKRNLSNISEIALFYLGCIRQTVHKWLCAKYFLSMQGSVLSFVFSAIFYPVVKVLSFPVFRPFLSIFHFIKSEEAEITHKKNTFTLLDTLSKLSIFSEYNAIYSEVNHEVQNDPNAKSTPEEELRKIFNVIVFEEDLESGIEAQHAIADYFVFFMSLVLVGFIAYITNPLDDIEGDAVLAYVLAPTGNALLLMYVFVCCSSAILRACSIRSKWIGISVVYCKLLIVVLLRFGIFPYFIGSVLVGFILHSPVGLFVDLSGISDWVQNSLVVLFYQKRSVGRFIFKIFTDCNIKSFIMGWISVLPILLGNAFITGLDRINRRTPLFIRPGISSWLFPMDIFLSRIVKDAIITNISGYILILGIFFIVIVAYYPVWMLTYMISTEVVKFFEESSRTRLEAISWFYYYIPVASFLFNGFSYFYSEYMSLLKRAAISLACILGLSSLLFDGPLPHKDISLNHLHYLPCKNHMPYNQKEIRKRKELVITKSEKEMYFDEKGNKKKITRDRIFSLDGEDTEWASFVISSGRAELLYNPLYSVFYVPPFYVLRIVCYVLAVVGLYLSLSIMSVMVVYVIFLVIENIRKNQSERLLSRVFQVIKPLVFLVCIEVGRLYIVYRDRRFLILRKLLFSLKRYFLSILLPFIGSIFAVLSKKVFSNDYCAPFIFHNNCCNLIWAISYSVGLSIVLWESDFPVVVLITGSGVLFMYTAVDRIIYSGDLVNSSMFIRVVTVLSILLSCKIYQKVCKVLQKASDTLQGAEIAESFYEADVILDEYLPKSAE